MDGSSTPSNLNLSQSLDVSLSESEISETSSSSEAEDCFAMFNFTEQEEDFLGTSFCFDLADVVDAQLEDMEESGSCSQLNLSSASCESEDLERSLWKVPYKSVGPSHPDRISILNMYGNLDIDTSMDSTIDEEESDTSSCMIIDDDDDSFPKVMNKKHGIIDGETPDQMHNSDSWEISETQSPQRDDTVSINDSLDEEVEILEDKKMQQKSTAMLENGAAPVVKTSQEMSTSDSDRPIIIDEQTTTEFQVEKYFEGDQYLQPPSITATKSDPPTVSANDDLKCDWLYCTTCFITLKEHQPHRRHPQKRRRIDLKVDAGLADNVYQCSICRGLYVDNFGEHLEKVHKLVRPSSKKHGKNNAPPTITITQWVSQYFSNVRLEDVQRCGICRKYFSCLSTFQNHLNVDHAEYQKYTKSANLGDNQSNQCPTCGKIFPDAYYFLKHVAHQLQKCAALNAATN